MWRALGERGILARVRGVVLGRPRTFTDSHQTPAERASVRADQRDAVLHTIRRYNPTVTVLQNVDFGHTYPQICLPYGLPVAINPQRRTLATTY